MAYQRSTASRTLVGTGARSERIGTSIHGQLGSGLESRSSRGGAFGGIEQGNTAASGGGEVAESGFVGGDAGMEVVEVDRGQEIVGAAAVGEILGAVRLLPKAEARVGGSNGMCERGGVVTGEGGGGIGGGI